MKGAAWAVSFQYPWDARKPFNLEHFLDVHLPLGLELTRKHLGLEPLGIVVHTYEPLAPDDPPAFAAVSQVYFASETEARRFLTLFEVEEAARLLGEDFANYTAGPPRAALSRVVDYRAAELNKKN